MGSVEIHHLLLPLVLIAAPAGAQCTADTVLLSEDFTDPSGWTVISNDGPALTKHHDHTWAFDNPGGRSLPLLTAPFAIADSDNAGCCTMDDTLRSPVVDTSGSSCVVLSFQHGFHWFNSGWDEIGDVDVRSAATGGAWVTVATYAGGDSSGLVTLDLSAYSAADLEVQFHYYNANWEWWWAVDDVVLSGASTLIFADGFETGTTSEWTETVPPP